MATSSNVTALRPGTDPVRTARAAHIHGLLSDERWSIRKSALSLGMTVSVLATRMNGSTPFLADELESIARLLKRDPVEFYAEYLSVGPAGIEPTTSTVEERQFDAEVIPLFGQAS